MTGIPFENLNILETIVVFLGLQFAGYSTSRTIDELPIQTNYRLLILWCITLSLLIPIALIKRRKKRVTEKHLNQIATKIATEISRTIRNKITEESQGGDREMEFKLTSPIIHPYQ